MLGGVGRGASRPNPEVEHQLFGHRLGLLELWGGILKQDLGKKTKIKVRQTIQQHLQLKKKN